MTPIEWLLGDDTGTSSQTILAVMTGSKIECVGVPLDRADFGRCHRLLAHFPEWRARLPEVANRYPKWAPLVREWDALTALYLAQPGAEGAIYTRLSELRNQPTKGERRE